MLCVVSREEKDELACIIICYIYVVYCDVDYEKSLFTKIFLYLVSKLNSYIVLLYKEFIIYGIRHQFLFFCLLFYSKHFISKIL